MIDRGQMIMISLFDCFEEFARYGIMTPDYSSLKSIRVLLSEIINEYDWNPHFEKTRSNPTDVDFLISYNECGMLLKIPDFIMQKFVEQCSYAKAEFLDFIGFDLNFFLGKERTDCLLFEMNAKIDSLNRAYDFCNKETARERFIDILAHGICGI